MRKGSKFADILNAANQPEEPAAEPLPAPAAIEEPPPAPKQGRRKSGKRSDPDYTPVTIYLKKDTYTQVQMRMLEQGRRREVSDLVQDLLAQWLESR